MTDDSKQSAQRKNWVEEIEVAGEKLVGRVRELADDARVRRIRVKARDGDVTVDIPLTVGAIAGGAVVIAAPVLAVLGALAAFVAKLDIEIIREAAPEAEAD
ncbi:MAG: DUF4342 domain-containing protein, partial [Pararhodobacter sp.]|nr:DUF4342 domain-containing protein [Pararhodobacter sp.]